MKIKLLTASLLLAATAAYAAPKDVTVDVPMAFPESLTSVANGTLYIGSMNLGAVYRVLPGENPDFIERHHARHELRKRRALAARMPRRTGA